jgi:nucleotide-binding universal stress UspA family protein
VLEKIVVGYAGDGAGRDAVALGAEIATATGGGLTVVFPYRPPFSRETSEQVQARVEAEVGAQLEALGAGGRARHDTYRWSPSSWPIHALHELAEYEHAELIVLGAAREDIGDRLHVSLMERMVHGSPCAVAVAPAGYAESIETLRGQAAAAPEGTQPTGVEPTVVQPAGVQPAGVEPTVVQPAGVQPAGVEPTVVQPAGVQPAGVEPTVVQPAGAPRGVGSRMRRIGVGFASSAEGRAAVTLARELAGRSGGSVTVIAGAGLEPALASYSFSSPAIEEVEQQMYEEIEQTLTRACKELAAENGVPIEHETVRGDPASVLVERSKELDLLVLGSRAYGPLRHVLLGSVSARVMREAMCPVLVVPRGVAGEHGHADEQPAGVTRQA